MNSLDSAVDDFAGLIVEDLGGGNVRIKPIEEAAIRAETNRIIDLLDGGVNPDGGVNLDSNDNKYTPLYIMLKTLAEIESKRIPGVKNAPFNDAYNIIVDNIKLIVSKLLEKDATITDNVKLVYSQESLPESIRELLTPRIGNVSSPNNTNYNNKFNREEDLKVKLRLAEYYEKFNPTIQSLINRLDGLQRHMDHLQNLKEQYGNIYNNQPGSNPDTLKSLSNKINKTQDLLRELRQQQELEARRQQQKPKQKKKHHKKRGGKQSNTRKAVSTQSRVTKKRARKAKTRKGARTKRVRNAKTRKASRRS
jgi:hypothetical protein